MDIDLGGGAEEFDATVGVDDAHTPLPGLLHGATLLKDSKRILAPQASRCGWTIRRRGNRECCIVAICQSKLK
jgi:hypothetical protein